MKSMLCPLAARIAGVLPLFVYVTVVNGQCALPGSGMCETATPICQPEFCDTLGLNVPDGPHNGWCGANTAIHNPRYYAFVAAMHTVEIEIRADYCSGGQNALQAAILGACPWTNQDVLACHPGTHTGGTLTLVATGLTIGATYWLVADGSASSVCTYTITHTSGISHALDVMPPDTVTVAADDICAGYTGLLIETSPVSNVHGYRWVASWDITDTLTTTEPSILLDVPGTAAPGDYSICVMPFSACDTADLATCAVIHVSIRADTAHKDTVRLCADAFPFAWNGIVIHEPGTYFSTAFSLHQCALDSLWTILPQDSIPVSDLLVQAGPCATDSTLVVLVDFDITGAGLDTFDLLAGETRFGRYAADQLPLLIPDFPGNATGAYAVSACRPGATSPDCCITRQFAGMACPGGSCQLSSPVLETTPCSGAWQFEFILDIMPVRHGPEGFSIVCDGRLFGPFAYEELPVRFGPFTADGSSFTILIFDNADPSCNLAITSSAIECSTALTPPSPAHLFIITGNGNIPAIHALAEIRLSVFTIDGSMMSTPMTLEAGSSWSLASFPPGLYIAFIHLSGRTFPVRLVRLSG